MIHWIDAHGLTVLAVYYLLISVLGTMPDLPADAAYLQRWGFAAAHAICGNMKNMLQAIQPASKKTE